MVSDYVGAGRSIGVTRGVHQENYFVCFINAEQQSKTLVLKSN